MDFSLSTEMQTPPSTVERSVRDELFPLEASLDETGALLLETAWKIF